MNSFIGLASGPPEFMERWKSICKDGQTEHDEWIEKLRKLGIKAAHPDDGWVNREENTVHFAYPQFDDGVKVGDKIALGWPGKHNETRIVTITKFVKGLFLDYWKFEESK